MRKCLRSPKEIQTLDGIHGFLIALLGCTVLVNSLVNSIRFVGQISDSCGPIWTIYYKVQAIPLNVFHLPVRVWTLRNLQKHSRTRKTIRGFRGARPPPIFLGRFFYLKLQNAKTGVRRRATDLGRCIYTKSITLNPNLSSKMALLFI